MSTTDHFQSGNYEVEESVGYLISRAKTMLSRAVDEQLTELDITHAQGSVFFMLSMGKCSTAAELSRELFIDSASMKRTLDRLERKECLVRIPDPQDKRLFKLELTDKGKELAAHLPAIYTQVLNVGFSGFTAEEIGFLKSLLRKLLANKPLLENKHSN
jgi:DNA-binding MarR family transcriptional regulator